MQHSLFSHFIQICYLSFKKCHPFYVCRNPILMISWVASIAATITWVYDWHCHCRDIYILFHMTFWIWMTVIFSNLADAIAEFSSIPLKQASKDLTSEKYYKKLSSLRKKDKYQLCLKSSIRLGDYILLEPGDRVPKDGMVVEGASYCNLSSITARDSLVIKLAEYPHNHITEGMIIESGWIIIRISRYISRTFIGRIADLLKFITRQESPSETAFHRLMLGLSILFIMVVINIKLISMYLYIDMPFIYVLALMITMVPTTLSGLLPAISTASANYLYKMKIFVKDKSALDHAIDVDMILIDKTGTITEGKRFVYKFIPLGNNSKKDLIDACYLGSLLDNTTEGVAIRNASISASRSYINFNWAEYNNVQFSATEQISGGDYQDVEIRKGSIAAIYRYLNIDNSEYDSEIKKYRRDIAMDYGTPILVIKNKEILGLIYLKDQLRHNAAAQIQQLRQKDIKTILVTGDNQEIAAKIASDLNMDEYVAEITPQQKQYYIKRLQKEGHVVAMFGDDASDSLAIAQADIGVSFPGGSRYVTNSCNIIALDYNLAAIANLIDITSKMLIKRGSIMIFAIAADISKYFIIVPALFNAIFPELSIMNLLKLYSLDSTVLAAVIANALIIVALIPLSLKVTHKLENVKKLWPALLSYGSAGIFSTFITIKILDIILIKLGMI